MKEIVERILREEREAAKRIERAREEAENIILQAKRESQALIEETVQKARDSSEKKKEGSLREFLAEKDRVIEEERAKSAGLKKAKEKDISRLASELFSRIMSIQD